MIKRWRQIKHKNNWELLKTEPNYACHPCTYTCREGICRCWACCKICKACFHTCLSCYTTCQTFFHLCYWCCKMCWATRLVVSRMLPVGNCLYDTQEGVLKWKISVNPCFFLISIMLNSHSTCNSTHYITHFFPLESAALRTLNKHVYFKPVNLAAIHRSKDRTHFLLSLFL